VQTLVFFVPGKPAGKGSRSGPGGVRNASRSTDLYERTVRIHTMAAILKRPGRWEPIAGAVDLTLLFYLPRPKGHYDRKGDLRADAPLRPLALKKDDVDKFARCVMDGMDKADLYVDDSLVCDLVVRKFYEQPGQGVGLSVRVRWV